MFFIRARKCLPFLSDLQLTQIAAKIIRALDDRGKANTLRFLKLMLDRRLEHYDGNKKIPVR
jgi:hypothetical protein